MKKNRINILLILLLLISAQSFAQFTTYNSSNSSLPNNFAHVSKMDANNNLWIGTDNGLTKFDGTNWYTYNTTNSNLPSNWVESIEIVDTNEIWIGTRAGGPGLCMFNGDSITLFDTINSIATPTDIYALKKDNNGNLWIGGDYITYKYDGVTLINVGASGPHYAKSFKINNGNLWVGCYGFGLYKYDGSTWTNYNMSNSGIPSDFVEKIDIDNANNIWMGGFGSTSDVRGLTKYDGSTWTNYSISNSDIPRNPIFDLVIDQHNVIWIANGDGNNPGGLVKFDGTNFTLISTSNSNLPTNLILDLNIDNFDRLVLSTYAQGFCFYNIPTPPPCNLIPDYSYANNGSGNYSFTNNSTGSFNQSHWSFGSGNSSVTNPNYTFTSNGDFIVALTIKNTAAGSSCFDYFVDTINVTGVTSPSQCNAGFVTYPDGTTGDITIINSAIGNNLSYSWSFGDGNSSVLQNPSHNYTTSGPFYLCLTVNDGAGCTDTYCDTINSNGIVFKQSGFTINVVSIPVITGLSDDFYSSSKVVIYPNPTSDQLKIVNPEFQINAVQIIDVTGKIVKTVKQSTSLINVADLKKGIYFVKVISNENTAIKKFIKE